MSSSELPSETLSQNKQASKQIRIQGCSSPLYKQYSIHMWFILRSSHNLNHVPSTV